MLHDPSHYAPPEEAREIVLSRGDREVLRTLAGELAAIASLPLHREKAALWTKLNSLESERPMVWINEICWHEMDVDGELALRTEHPWARDQERDLRRTLYQWKHLPADMVIDDVLSCPLAIHSTDFGIVEDVEVRKTDETSDVVSRHFNIQIAEPEDIEKIEMPTVTHNEEATAFRYRAMRDVYEGILPVRKVGQTHIWFAPWDYLIRWMGIQEGIMNLIMKPALVHAAVARLVDAWMVELDQFVEMNLLSLDNRNIRVGSGGYGYCRDLPGDDYDPADVGPHNMWGCSNAQIFSEVSPRMHWEFALEHAMKWLRRWGLTYYGCCEPLHNKFHLMKKIPNLRKVSISPWCDMDRAVEELGDEYVLSIKPNPAVLAEDTWRPDKARNDIRAAIEKTGGHCHVEIIMKDISTVRYEPQRLWEWSAIAVEEAGG